jgi:hypothetical protein
MEAIKNIKMVEAARKEAVALIQQDASLSKFPTLSDELARRKLELLHFE